MPGIGLKIDPVGEDAANVPLDLNDGTKFRALKAQYPTPPRRVNWSSSADTEGSLPANLQYDNRQITIEDRVYGSSASDLQTQLGYLEQKIGKINDEGATHEYVSPSGVVCIFDLLEAQADYELDNRALANKFTTVTIVFTAKPFWRSGLANEVAGVDHAEATLPCVVGVDTTIAGDVPALGRLVIDEDQGADQLSLLWGVQSRYYSNAATAELFYQAESRTPLSGAATAALTGASGAGSNTVRHTELLPSWQAVLSTQASGGGSHLSHVGTYRVLARVQRPTSNTGAVSLCLEWGQGDFLRRTVNDSVDYAADELEGVWMLVDLGLVQLDKVTAGTQRWEGRVLAKSTVGKDDIYVDCLMLFPVDEGYGSLKVTPSLTVPSSILAHDEFDQVGGGTLAAKVAPAGGTWSEAGSAKGVFSLDSTNHYVTRTAVSDPESLGIAEGRYGILGTTEYTDIVVGADVFISAASSGGRREYGVCARYVGESIAGVIAPSESGFGSWRVKRPPFTGTNFGSGLLPFNPVGQWLQLRLAVSSAGRWEFWCNGLLLGSGNDSNLATGGELAKGKIGIYDQNPGPGGVTRIYDNFIAFPPAFDVAVFSKQSAEVRADRMQREDAAGALWVARKDYKGSYFTLPPSRREARPARTIVKLSRGNTDTMADSGIDDASFKIFWQPRGLVLPES